MWYICRDNESECFLFHINKDEYKYQMYQQIRLKGVAIALEILNILYGNRAT